MNTVRNTLLFCIQEIVTQFNSKVLLLLIFYL